LRARDGREVCGALELLFGDAALRARMTGRIRGLARPGAAADIAAIVSTRLRMPVAA
jgi:hypothetical protein